MVPEDNDWRRHSCREGCCCAQVESGCTYVLDDSGNMAEWHRPLARWKGRQQRASFGGADDKYRGWNLSTSDFLVAISIDIGPVVQDSGT